MNFVIGVKNVHSWLLNPSTAASLVLKMGFEAATSDIIFDRWSFERGGVRYYTDCTTRTMEVLLPNQQWTSSIDKTSLYSLFHAFLRREVLVPKSETFV
jgi:hypothetical protein